MNCKFYHVPLPLQKYVRYFWSIDVSKPGDSVTSVKLFADKYPRIIFQDMSNVCKSMKDETGEILPDMFLSGITTRCTKILLCNTYSQTGISFHPHALKYLFGIDAYELTDIAPDLTNFIPTELSKRLYGAQNHGERISLLSAYLISRAEKCKDDDCMTSALMHAASKVGETNMKQLLNIYRRSDRQLERKFRNELGITPKMLMRINRFEKSVGILKTKNESSLSRIAYSLGYFDQAHFIKEFKFFSGVAPLKFISEKEELKKSIPLDECKRIIYL